MKAFLNGFLQRRVSEESNNSQSSMFDSKKLYYRNLSDSTRNIIKRVFALLIISSAVGIIMATITHTSSPIVASQNLQAKRSQIIMNQLNDIHDKVQALQLSPQSGEALKVMLVSINAEIGDVKQSLDAMKSDMDSQMNDIRKAVTQNPNAKQYIDSKELPFKVISIDVIAQQPYASVDYDHHITALGVGDALAGWQVTETDYQKATVEFKNSQDQYIKIVTQG